MLFTQRDMAMIVRFTKIYAQQKAHDLDMEITQEELTHFVERTAEKVSYLLSGELVEWKKTKEIECALQEPDGIY